MAIPNIGFQKSVHTGHSLVQVLYVWGPLLGVALLAVAMRNPLSQTMQAYQLDRRRENCKLFFNYQLPPRKLWTWLLENGLTVTDLILVRSRFDNHDARGSRALTAKPIRANNEL